MGGNYLLLAEYMRCCDPREERLPAEVEISYPIQTSATAMIFDGE